MAKEQGFIVLHIIVLTLEPINFTVFRFYG